MTLGQVSVCLFGAMTRSPFRAGVAHLLMEGSNLSIWPKGFEFLRNTPNDGTLSNNILSSDVIDVTGSSQNELASFSPYIRLIGINAITEQSKNPTSLLYRAVEKRGSNERCLQYLYIYKHQFGFLELESIAMIVFLLGPLFLLLLWTPRTFLDIIGSKSVVVTLGLYLLFFGLKPHWEDSRRIEKGARLRPRASTPFAIAGIIMFLVWIDYSCLFRGYYCFCVCLLVYFLFEKLELVPTSHRMDYAPVFVYIKKEDVTNSWIFQKACWDKYHYTVDGYQSSTNNNQRLIDQKRIMLKIDNPWHDFAALYAKDEADYRSHTIRPTQQARISKKVNYRRHIRAWLVLGIGGILFLYESVTNMEVGFLISPTLLIVTGGFLLAAPAVQNFIYLRTMIDRQTQLKSFTQALSMVQHKHHLDHTKLSILWKLPKRKMKLKIIEVMQDPFRDDPDCFNRFSPSYLEKLFSKVKTIRERSSHSV